MIVSAANGRVVIDCNAPEAERLAEHSKAAGDVGEAKNITDAIAQAREQMAKRRALRGRR